MRKRYIKHQDEDEVNAKFMYYSRGFLKEFLNLRVFKYSFKTEIGEKEKHVLAFTLRSKVYCLQ